MMALLSQKLPPMLVSAQRLFTAGYPNNPKPLTVVSLSRLGLNVKSRVFIKIGKLALKQWDKYFGNND